MADDKNPIQPFYTTTTPNQRLLLGQAELHVQSDGHRFTCLGEACLHLQPRLCLALNADISDNPTNALRLNAASEPVALQFGTNAQSIKALIVKSALHIGQSGSTAKVTFIPNPQRLTICDDRRKRLAAVTFHVLNFPAFISQGEAATDLLWTAPSGASQRLGRVFLEHRGWQIELQSLPNAGELIEQLDTEGGYAITHVGRLTRKNGSQFWISQSEAVLRDLHQFLSFARGLLTCSPLVPHR